MADTEPEWRQYERHIFEKLKEWGGDQAEVEFDTKLPGQLSEIERQIDCLVTGAYAGKIEKNATAAVDCKCYSRKFDVTDVEAFMGLVEDVQTDFGLLITTVGFSPAAKRRVTRGIKLHVVPRVVVAMIDELPPPTYYVEWGDDHYEGSFWPEDPYTDSSAGALVSYHYVERESPFPVDHPDDLEWLDTPVLSGPLDEVDWSTDSARKHVATAVLTHYLGRQPTKDELESFILEVASEWKDGEPWSITVDEITAKTGLWANINEQ